MAVYVGIELSRDIRLSAGGVQSPASRSVGGVNLLRHGIQLALKITAADYIQVLTPDVDAALLEICGEFGVREGGVMPWVAGLGEKAAAAKPEDAVVLLRQTAPLRDEKPLIEALKLLKKQRCVVSASKPPAGHSRHKPLPGHTEPDYRVQAFEIWRLSEFSKFGFGGVPGDRDKPLFIDWDSFVEIARPEDETRAAKLLAAIR
ncbi:MAG: hypothetical protein IT462_17180 [Planctomycetes bacterium]|nr:hypothetical protein [Planctomycetota bacterium]